VLLPIRRVGQVLLDKEGMLRIAGSDSGPVAFVRARTMAALERVDANRKKAIILFLYGAGLIGRVEHILPDNPDLMNQLEDESKSAEERVQIVFQKLSAGVRMSHAPAIIDLSGADLSEINLKLAYLSGIDLSQTVMNRADLTSATLDERASLLGTALEDAHLSTATLDQASLRHANLTRAELSAASLERAHLEQANLTDANLSMAWLEGAVLDGADLTNANLSDAFDVTDEQLAA
jgi:hypothetical protein